MRKDVKVGLAAGGVLLAVIIVYISSVSKPSRNAPGATLVTTTADGRPAPPVSDDGGEGVRVVVADATPATDDAARGDAVATAAPVNAAEPDWAKILETGAPPALMSAAAAPDAPRNDVFADRAPAPAPPAAERAAASVATTPVDLVNLPAANVGSAQAVGATTVLLNGPSTPTAAPRPAADAARPAVAPRAYVIKENESFYTIARDVYGNSHFYPHISRANPSLDPNRIRAGMTIVLPDPATVKPAEPAVRPTTPPAGADAPTASRATRPLAADEYRVLPDENLYRIAAKLYGSPTRMRDLYEFNKAAIGDDPSKLKVGTVLKLPPGARAAN